MAMHASSSSAAASLLSPETRKRRAPETGLDDHEKVGASAAPAVRIELDDETRRMTVEAYLRHYLAKSIERATGIADDAVDALSLQYKQLREELQNVRHTRKMEQAASKKAGRKKIWDLQLVVEESGEGCEELVGRAFLLRPRQTPSGMCKVGRSTGDDFFGDRGASLSRDMSVSTWHGKFTSVYGTIYYTDLNTKNGSRHNGVRVEKDTPTPLRNGDTITVGDTTLRIELKPGTEIVAAAAIAAGGKPAVDDEMGV